MKESWTLRSEGHKMPAWLRWPCSFFLCRALTSDQMQVRVLLHLLGILAPSPLSAVHQQVTAAASHWFSRGSVSQRWLSTNAVSLTGFCDFFLQTWWAMAHRLEPTLSGADKNVKENLIQGVSSRCPRQGRSFYSDSEDCTLQHGHIHAPSVIVSDPAFLPRICCLIFSS